MSVDHYLQDFNRFLGITCWCLLSDTKAGGWDLALSTSIVTHSSQEIEIRQSRGRRRRRRRMAMSYYLPDEMVLDILQRLPVKSLVRFRCVSKSWNSLITSPAFIHSHLNRSIPNTPPHTIFIVRHCVSNPHRELEREPYKLFAFDECGELDLPIKSRSLKNFRLIGSENGLMCFVGDKQFILWNPSIRKVVNLPEPCITTERYGRMPCNEAFGFDLRTNDYKIVRIAFPYSYSAMLGGPLVEVYSVSTGSWRISSATFPYSVTVTDWFNPKACLKGSIHFAGHIRGYATVFSFDLRDELFREMILPKSMVPLNTDIDVGIVTRVFKGSLALLCYHKQATRRGCCSIWVMKEYGVVDSWVQQFTIDIAGGIENVLGFSKNGHIILEARKIGWPGYWEHFSYDPESQEATNLGMHDHTFWVDTYKENLVLLNQANDLVSESSVTKKRKNSKLNCALEEMI
ncbi:F-box/kelch-repeat protein At3g23880-like [Corylus avellana]|uniref:F-box/kelch-repeat protein At3g23880-like n=1 Tax=Corylus avellana TaxID=13451 RepID=UPI00286CB8A1|nr:F-box/kelch-repeat protein At3g23880-like [Corylus avellana]